MHRFPLRKAGPRLSTSLGVALIIAVSTVFAGCAEDRSNLLPGDTVKEISANLDQVRDLADSGDCQGALSAAQVVTRQIEGLGTAVDARLKRSLREGANQLVMAIQQNCETSDSEQSPVETTVPEVTEEPDQTEEEPKNEETPKPTTGTGNEQPDTGGATTPNGGAETPPQGGAGTGTTTPDTSGQNNTGSTDSGNSGSGTGGLGPAGG